MATGTEIVARARSIYKDDGTRLTDPDALNWLNDGVAEIVALKPNSFPSTANVSLVAGTRQTITGVMLLDVGPNMGSDGNTPGKAVKLVSRDVMDAAYPEWTEALAMASVAFCIYDKNDPKTFHVFPPQPANTTQRLRTVQAVIPAPMVSLASAVPAPDEYLPALVDYVLYRTFITDDDAAMVERGNAHYQAFTSKLGGKASAEAAAGRTNA